MFNQTLSGLFFFLYINTNVYVYKAYISSCTCTYMCVCVCVFLSFIHRAGCDASLSLCSSFVFRFQFFCLVRRHQKSKSTPRELNANSKSPAKICNKAADCPPWFRFCWRSHSPATTTICVLYVPQTDTHLYNTTIAYTYMHPYTLCVRRRYEIYMNYICVSAVNQ